MKKKYNEAGLGEVRKIKFNPPIEKKILDGAIPALGLDFFR